MAKHGVRQQKRLAKQKAKRAERQTQVARATSADPTIRLRESARWPIVEALVPDNLWTCGIGQIVLSRRAPDGQMAFGVYLVDVFCLGVKNAFWNIKPPGDYADLIEKIDSHGALEEVAPEYAAKLIQGAIDYAQALGFAPHPDFRSARLLLAGIDAECCPDRFEFGKDGKPFYVSGPHDSPEKVRLIVSRVGAAGGHYMAHIGGDSLPAGIDFDDDEFDDDESD